MLKVLLSPNDNFAPDTWPSQVETSTGILLISAQIDNAFRMAGYVLPFLPLPGEGWPISQTTYLQMLTMLGTAAMVGGHILKPAPTSRGKPLGGENSLQHLYEKELAKIHNYDPIRGQERANSRFRALYYANTPAAKSLAQPIGPMTDTSYLGRVDPSRFYSLRALADLAADLKAYFDTRGSNFGVIQEMVQFQPNSGFGPLPL